MLRKRDDHLQRRRKLRLRCPTTKVVDYQLEKYQATEEKLKEVKMLLAAEDCSYEQLYIYQNQINDKKTDMLCEVIESNKSLIGFHFVNCKLRQNQLQNVCVSLMNHKAQSLLHLHISQVRINKFGAQAIAQLLTKLKVLEKLELVNTNMDNESMQYLCSDGIKNCKSLEYLDLRNNNFDDKGLVALVKALQKNLSVKYLFLEDIKFNLSQSKMLADLLCQQNCNIEQLALHQADFDIDSLDTIMNALYQADHLQKLSLSKNFLDVNICEHLSEITQRLHKFQILCLSHCEIGHDGLKSLCEGSKYLDTVKELDLSWNNINSSGMLIILQMLEQNKTLEKLLIQHNFLQVDGAKHMVEALKLHPQMTYLDISANEITSQGFLYFEELFLSNHHLTNLMLRKNAIDGFKVKNMPKALIDNHNLLILDLRDNEIENEFSLQVVELLKHNHIIEGILLKGNLHINQNLKEAIQEESRKNMMIKEYIVPNLKLKDNQINHSLNTPAMIKEECSARQNVHECHFEKYDVSELYMKDCSFYRSDFIVKFIQMNPKEFQTLSLTRVYFEEHLKDLVEFLKQSKTQIKRLILNDCNIDEVSLSQLVSDSKTLQQIQEFRLKRINTQEKIRDIVKCFINHKNLLILDLSNNQISKMKCISELLTKNQVIQQLNLKGNPITQETDLRALLFGLTQNISLVELYYDNQYITDVLAKKEIMLIEKQLQLNRYIGQEILPIQQQMKLKNSDTVDLSHKFNFMSPILKPQIKDSIIKSILKYFLIQMPQKKKINLSYCRVDDQTVDLFVQGLMSDVVRHQIELLDLSYNHIGDESCAHLAKLFQANYHITKLNIGKNQNITSTGLRSIIGSIKNNNNIQVIDVQTCNIDLDGATNAALLERELIFEDIQVNCSLIELDLQFNIVNEQWLKRINAELEQNKQISQMILPYIKQQETREYQKRLDNMQLQRKMTGKLNSATKTLNKNSIMQMAGNVIKSSTASLRPQKQRQQFFTMKEMAGLYPEESKQQTQPMQTRRSSFNLENEQDLSMNSTNQLKMDKDNNQRAMQSLCLKGKGIKSLDFLEKYMRVNPNLVDIDIGDNPLSSQAMQKFTMNMRKNQLIQNIGLDGISSLDPKTRDELQKEIQKNAQIQQLIELQEQGGINDKNTLVLKQQDIQQVDFLQKFMQQFNDLKELDLTDNRLGNRGAIELCHLIKETKTIQTLILSKNRIGPSGLSHICSAMTFNQSIKVLDISDNMIQDESLKTLLAMLYINEVILNIKYTVTNEENIRRLALFESNKHLKVDEIVEKLQVDHSDQELTIMQKVCLPVLCWKSFIHAKHEAFRFKYDSNCLKMVENEIMNKLTVGLYISSITYYIIMFGCPMFFVNECGKSLNMTSHIIYGAYALLNWFFEIMFVVWIQKKIKNKQILIFNKWHFVESIMGQIARFDTYLDMCFFVLLFQCSEWILVIPIGSLILINISYPIYQLIKQSTLKQSFDHAMPKIERNCNICFVRENMLIATVLDSFCIDNHTEICKKPYHFGRVQAIWTLATQDGPQMLIHLLFLFLVQNDVSHADTTVVMSIIVSSFAIMISVFNIIMCSQNEFDPILLQIELKKRQDKFNNKELKIKAMKEDLKKKMMSNYEKQNKTASIANFNQFFSNNRSGSLSIDDQNSHGLKKLKQNVRQPSIMNNDLFSAGRRQLSQISEVHSIHDQEDFTNLNDFNKAKTYQTYQSNNLQMTNPNQIFLDFERPVLQNTPAGKDQIQRINRLNYNSFDSFSLEMEDLSNVERAAFDSKRVNFKRNYPSKKNEGPSSRPASPQKKNETS